MNETEVRVSKANPMKTGPLFGKNNNILDRKQKVDRENNIHTETITCQDNINGDTSVLQRFYSGASVFVTGATGFMGKVLLEKLLRSCPDIEMVYILVREKKGRSLEERVDDLTSSACFHRIIQEFPEFRSKLSPMAGDIGEENLGISESDRHILAQKVKIVFHVAATVRFDEKLKTAILQNVRGTRELITLCRSFTKLKAVLHVSTAYSQCPNIHVAERLYESPLDCRKAIEMAETMDLDVLEQQKPKLFGEWPNSYAFTKAVSEDVIKVFGQGLPVAIVRPSIVVCTNAEPMSGWIDNLYGPTGVLVGVSAGVLRTLHAKSHIEANIVPCDMAINAMVASAWDTATNRPRAMPVYNYICPAENKLTWKDYMNIYLRYGIHYPSSRCIWYWTMTLCSNRLVYLLLRLLLHTLPALLMDLALVVTNRKPQMIRLYKKVHKFSDVLAYFSTRTWKFHDQNVVDLWDRLDSRDQELFFFDMRSLDWDTYVKDTCAGLSLYILQESVDKLPEARRRFKRLYVIHRITQLLLVCLLLWCCSLVYTLFSSTTHTDVHLNVPANQELPLMSL